MEDNMIFERLNSFWFFSNILSPPAISCIHADITQEAHVSDLQQQPKQPTPGTQILNPVHIEPPTSLVHVADAGTGSARLALEPETSRVSRDPKECMVKRRKASKKKQITRRSELRKDIKEINEFMRAGIRFTDLGSDFTPVHTLSGHQGRTKSYDICGKRKPVLCCNMPSLNDGLAMKEHLKSWAYAVACTVR